MVFSQLQEKVNFLDIDVLDPVKDFEKLLKRPEADLARLKKEAAKARSVWEDKSKIFRDFHKIHKRGERRKGQGR